MDPAAAGARGSKVADGTFQRCAGPSHPARGASRTTADADADARRGRRRTAPASRPRSPATRWRARPGPSRKIDAHGHYVDRYMASFVGFLPASDPTVVIAVSIDEPRTVYGGVAAAPLFRRSPGTRSSGWAIPAVAPGPCRRHRPTNFHEPLHGPRPGARVSSGPVAPVLPPTLPFAARRVGGRSRRPRSAATPLHRRGGVRLPRRRARARSSSACPGATVDGHDFAAAAVEAGAAALVVERWLDRRPCPRSWCPRCARRWARCRPVVFGHPAAAMTMVGVTGTNGKTTTTYLLEAIVPGGRARARG